MTCRAGHREPSLRWSLVHELIVDLGRPSRAERHALETIFRPKVLALEVKEGSRSKRGSGLALTNTNGEGYPYQPYGATITTGGCRGLYHVTA